MRSRPPRPLAVVLALSALGALSLAASRAQDAPKEEAKKTGFIGISMDAVALEVPKGAEPQSAIRVLALVPGSPAEAAGVKPGGLVLALDGEGFRGVETKDAVNVFRARLKPHGVGERVRLLVARDVVTVDGAIDGKAQEPRRTSTSTRTRTRRAERLDEAFSRVSLFP